MQPTTFFVGLICNTLIDNLFEKAKEMEARYNKHVSIHKNTIQKNLEAIPREEKNGFRRDDISGTRCKKMEHAHNSIITQEGGGRKGK